MKLPQISNHNVSSHLNQVEIIKETAAQIMKDFGMFGVEITFSGDVDNAYNELHEQLIGQVLVLMEQNYELLMSVLYQVDITEREIAQAERELPHYNPVEILAHQIIARDLKKVLLRRYFKAQSSSSENSLNQ